MTLQRELILAWLCILVHLTSVLAADAPEVWTPPPSLSPADSLKTIQVPADLSVELVAAEPLVFDPVSIAWGPDGKLWVVEMTDYNHLPINDPSPDKPKGRVIYLTDKDNDGTYDTRTVFLEGLNYPNGVLPWRKGVLITSAPDILYAEDTDNDGKADKSEVLYTGFNEGNPQLRINGLSWGLDGWIYCANGLSHGVVKSTKTGTTLDIRGRDLRIRPDTGELEAASGPSQFGRVRDDFGNWFGVDNSRLIIHYVLEDHYLRRNPHVPTPEPFIDLVTPRNPPCYPRGHKVERLHAPYMANRFTSACGIGIYRDTWLGESYYGQVFICEPVHNLVTRRKLTPDGVTFKADRVAGEEQSEFLTSTDEWFRPVQVRTGPDGALYVVDMYRAVIEHPQWVPKDFNKQVNWMEGKDKGRIYRIVKRDAKRRAVPDFSTKENLLTAIESPNGTLRDLAQIEVNNRKAEMRKLESGWLVKKLEERVERAAGEIPSRVQTLCVLDDLAGVSTRLLAQTLTQESHPEMLRQAARISERSSDGASAGDLVDLIDKALVKLAGRWWHASPAKLQLIYSLGQFKSKGAGETLGRVFGVPFLDPYMGAALLSSARGHLTELAHAAISYRTSNADSQANLVASIVAEKNDEALIIVLARIAEDRIGVDDSWSWRMLRAVLDSLSRRGITLARLAETNEDFSRAIKELQHQFVAARSIAVNGSGNNTVRFDAIRVVGRGLESNKDDTKTLLALVSPSESGEIQELAVTALLSIAPGDGPKMLTSSDRWKGLGPRTRGLIVEQLLRREAWTKNLLDAAESGGIATSDIATAQWQALRNHKTPAIRERAVKLHGSVKSNRADVLASHQDALKLQGDLAQGRTHYEKTCAVCHKLAGVGKGHAPDLSSLTDRSPSALLTAILDPNQAVDPRYVNYLAETAQGDTVTGMLLSESGASVMLVGADGTKHTILRKDLLTLRSTSLSLMPEGLEQSLGKQGLADVIAYVISRSQPVRVLEGVKPRVIGADRNDMLILTARDCEAFGTRIIYEREDTNLGHWSSADDYVTWTLEVKDAGKYEAWFDYACDDAWAGNTITLSAEDDAGHNDALTTKVPTTKTFNDFAQTKFGELELPAGQVRVTLRAAGPIKGHLMDLRSVRLTPVKQ